MIRLFDFNFLTDFFDTFVPHKYNIWTLINSDILLSVTFEILIIIDDQN